MSWDQTYSHTVALAVDRFGAALIFNQPDITISSLCWIERTACGLPSGESNYSQYVCDQAKEALASLKLARWQLFALEWIGNGLERFRPGHCEDARQGDLDTSARSRALLGGV